jgi:SPP1 family predicted phage head-tail adaptor
MAAPRIKAGSLDRRVTLCEQRQTRDALGGFVTSLYIIATVWAEVLALSGRLVDAVSEQRIAETDAQITIRHRSGIDQRTIIVYRDEAYDLQAVNELGRCEGLQCMARRIRPQPATLPHPLVDFDGALLVDFDGGSLMTV